MQGDAARTALSISDRVTLEDGYVLSGMRLGNGTEVWRFTPSVSCSPLYHHAVDSHPNNGSWSLVRCSSSRL